MPRSLALLALLSLAACDNQQSLELEEVETFIDEPVHAVNFTVDNGSVEVIALRGEDRIRVERLIWSTPQSPASSNVRVDDGTLHATASCDGAPIRHCSVDYRVFVPADVATFISLADGYGLVDRLSGPVEIQTALGDILLRGVAGPVSARTEEGAIDGRDLTSARVTAWTLEGDVSLGFVGPIDALDTRTRSGDIDLRLPAGPYALDLTADWGAVHVERVTNDLAAAPVRATTDAGDVEIFGH